MVGPSIAEEAVRDGWVPFHEEIELEAWGQVAVASSKPVCWWCVLEACWGSEGVLWDSQSCPHDSGEIWDWRAEI